jgi:hypothetical protein
MEDNRVSRRRAIAAYHDIEVAVDAGYTVELPQTAAYGGGTCIANGADGAMGIHMVSPERIDAVLDEADPEALLYERRNDGTLKLTGVEYIVAPRPSSSDGSSPSRTWVIGTPPTSGHCAWVFKPNQAASCAWNPNVGCD